MQSKRKRSLLVPFCVLAIAGAAVLIGWFVHMMALQTSWKKRPSASRRVFQRCGALRRSDLLRGNDHRGK